MRLAVLMLLILVFLSSCTFANFEKEFVECAKGDVSLEFDCALQTAVEHDNIKACDLVGGPKRETCQVLLADAKRECVLLENAVLRERCLYQVAVEELNYHLCSFIPETADAQFPEYSQQACIAQIALDLGSASLCQHIINDEQAKDMCLFTLGKAKLAWRTCEQVMAVDLRDECITFVSLVDRDPRPCAKLSDSEKEAACVFAVKNDVRPAPEFSIADCDARASVTARDTCIHDLAQHGRDSALCFEISTAEGEEDCRHGLNLGPFVDFSDHDKRIFPSMVGRRSGDDVFVKLTLKNEGETRISSYQAEFLYDTSALVYSKVTEGDDLNALAVHNEIAPGIVRFAGVDMKGVQDLIVVVHFVAAGDFNRSGFDVREVKIGGPDFEKLTSYLAEYDPSSIVWE